MSMATMVMTATLITDDGELDAECVIGLICREDSVNGFRIVG